MSIRAVLFDIDGTLLDSNDAHAHAWLDSLRGHGKNVPFELIRSKIGMGADKLLAEVAGIDDKDVFGQSIQERRTAILKAHYLPDVGPHHGARLLVDRLRSRGLVCVVVSSSSSGEDAANLLRIAGVADLIDLVVTADDADRSMDLVEVALHALGLEASEAVMIGDTPYDIEACRRANVAVIAVRCGGWKDEELDGAIAIFDDPEELCSKLDETILSLALERESTPPPPRRRMPRQPMRGA